MALFGDGGILGSKPYAASGKYIHKMSNFCQKCIYNPDDLLGEFACPFNALYWDFFARNRKKLAVNQRISYVYGTWDKFTELKQTAIRAKAVLDDKWFLNARVLYWLRHIQRPHCEFFQDNLGCHEVLAGLHHEIFY